MAAQKVTSRSSESAYDPVKPSKVSNDMVDGFSSGFFSPLNSVMGKMVSIGFIKCIAMVSFLVGYRLFDPTYAHPRCLLRLVNETEPAHFAAHRYWRTLEYGDCPDLEGMVLNQFNTAAQFELKAFKFVNLATVVISAYVIVSRFMKKGEKVNPLSLLFCNLTAGHFTMAVIYMYVHFQNDLTWFIGNMQHHSDISRFTDKSNASAVDTLPNGFFACYMFNVAWVIAGFRFLSTKIPLLSEYSNSKFCTSLFMISGFISIVMLKGDHPTFHAVANESMKDAVPFSFEYRAYHHVFVHHVDGDSFGSSYVFDPIFSHAFTFLAYVHSHVFGISSPDSLEHYAVVIVFDILQSFTVMAMLIAMYTWSAKMVKVLNTDSSVIAKSGAVAWCGGSVFFWLFTNGFILKPTYSNDEL